MFYLPKVCRDWRMAQAFATSHRQPRQPALYRVVERYYREFERTCDERYATR